MGRKAMTPEQREAMRRRILNAARAQFLETGIDGVSMRGVAAKTGVSSMTLYLYYENRQDLVNHLLMEGFEQLLWEVRDAIATSSKTNALENYRDAYTTFALNSPEFYKAMFRYIDKLEPSPLEEHITLLTPHLINEHEAWGLLVTLHGAAMFALAGVIQESEAQEVGKTYLSLTPAA